MLDLAADPAKITETLGQDALLTPGLRRHPGLRIPGAFESFEVAVRAVLGQQVSVAAARTLAGRLVDRFGAAFGDAVTTSVLPSLASPVPLTRVFPRPSDLAEAEFNGLGLTRRRQETLRALSRAVVDGTLDFDADPNEVREALSVLPGIGPWTVEYVALRALADPDAFPASDLVLRKAAGQGTPLSKKILEARAEAWRPWRAYAAAHLWRAQSEARA